MRINGRTLRPSTPTERRLLKSLGSEALHVPRRENPFRVARKIEQLASKIDQELSSLRRLTRSHLKPHEPQPSPGLDLPDHEWEQDDALCA